MLNEDWEDAVQAEEDPAAAADASRFAEYWVKARAVRLSGEAEETDCLTAAVELLLTEATTTLSEPEVAATTQMVPGEHRVVSVAVSATGLDSVQVEKQLANDYAPQPVASESTGNDSVTPDPWALPECNVPQDSAWLPQHPDSGHPIQNTMGGNPSGKGVSGSPSTPTTTVPKGLANKFKRTLTAYLTLDYVYADTLVAEVRELVRDGYASAAVKIFFKMVMNGSDCDRMKVCNFFAAMINGNAISTAQFTAGLFMFLHDFDAVLVYMPEQLGYLASILARCIGMHKLVSITVLKELPEGNIFHDSTACHVLYAEILRIVVTLDTCGMACAKELYEELDIDFSEADSLNMYLQSHSNAEVAAHPVPPAHNSSSSQEFRETNGSPPPTGNREWSTGKKLLQLFSSVTDFVPFFGGLKPSVAHTPPPAGEGDVTHSSSSSPDYPEADDSHLATGNSDSTTANVEEEETVRFSAEAEGTAEIEAESLVLFFKVVCKFTHKAAVRYGLACVHELEITDPAGLAGCLLDMVDGDILALSVGFSQRLGHDKVVFEKLRQFRVASPLPPIAVPMECSPTAVSCVSVLADALENMISTDNSRLVDARYLVTVCTHFYCLYLPNMSFMDVCLHLVETNWRVERCEVEVSIF